MSSITTNYIQAEIALAAYSTFTENMTRAAYEAALSKRRADKFTQSAG